MPVRYNEDDDNIDTLVRDVFGYGESKVLQNSGAGGAMHTQNAEGGVWTDGEQSFLGRRSRGKNAGDSQRSGISGLGIEHDQRS